MQETFSPSAIRVFLSLSFSLSLSPLLSFCFRNSFRSVILLMDLSIHSTYNAYDLGDIAKHTCWFFLLIEDIYFNRGNEKNVNLAYLLILVLFHAWKIYRTFITSTNLLCTTVPRYLHSHPVGQTESTNNSFENSIAKQTPLLFNWQTLL